MIELWVMRHGKTRLNRDKLANLNKKKAYPLQKKVYNESILPSSIKDIKGISKKLKNKKIDIIFCSELKRSIETANIIKKELGCNKVIIDKRLNEVNYGIFEGKIFDEIKFLKKEKEKKGDIFEIKFPEGEKLGEVNHRINSFLNCLKKNYDGKKILLVTHYTPIKMILIKFLNRGDINKILIKGVNKSLFNFII